MSDKLVTIETFDNSIEAAIVRSQLEAEGIRVFLADEAMAGMTWHYGVATGGVKLQVGEDDVERVLALLEAKDCVSITEDDWQVADVDDVFESNTDEDYVEEDEAVSPTDELVDRAYRAAVLGLLYPPLQLYSFWLLGRIALGGGSLTATNRRKVLITVVCNLPTLVICWLLTGWGLDVPSPMPGTIYVDQVIVL